LIGTEDNLDIWAGDQEFGMYNPATTPQKTSAHMTDNHEYYQFRVAAADKQPSIGKRDI
jgi:hypothetical protein